MDVPLNIPPDAIWFFDRPSSAFFAVSKNRSMYRLKIDKNMMESSDKVDLKEFSIQLSDHKETKNEFNIELVEYNDETRALAIVIDKAIYIAILLFDGETEKEADTVFFTRIASANPLRNVKEIAFHPINPQLIILLFERDIIEVFDLSIDIDSCFLYLNYNYDNNVIIDKIVMLEAPFNCVKRPEQLLLFGVSNKLQINFTYGFLFPRVYLDRELFEYLDEQVDILKHNEWERSAEIDAFKNDVFEYCPSVDDNRISKLTEFNDSRIKQVFSIEDSWNNCVEELYMFKCFFNEQIGVIYLTVFQNSFKSSNKKKVIEVGLSVSNDDLIPIDNYKYEMNRLFSTDITINKEEEFKIKIKDKVLVILTEEKVYKMNFSFLEAFQFNKMNYDFQDDFENKLKKSINVFNMPQRLTKTDFFFINKNKIVIHVPKEKRGLFMILDFSKNETEDKEPISLINSRSDETNKLLGQLEKTFMDIGYKTTGYDLSKLYDIEKEIAKIDGKDDEKVRNINERVEKENEKLNALLLKQFGNLSIMETKKDILNSISLAMKDLSKKQNEQIKKIEEQSKGLVERFNKLYKLQTENSESKKHFTNKKLKNEIYLMEEKVKSGKIQEDIEELKLKKENLEQKKGMMNKETKADEPIEINSRLMQEIRGNFNNIMDKILFLAILVVTEDDDIWCLV